jgi:uncharacterized protein YaiE (UPF0345 family)
MAPVQSLLGVVGLSKQTAKGSAAATPATFGFGVLGGKILQFPIAQDADPITLPGGASDRFPATSKRTQILPGAAFQTRAYPRSLGLLTYGALGGESVAGTNPYTHTQTPALALPYLTVFGRYGNASESAKIADCKVDELTIAWSETEPLTVDATLLGITPTFDSAFTFTNDESITTPFSPIGGTLRFDVDGTTLGTEPVTAASVAIRNNLTPVMLSSKVLPDDIMEGQQVVDGSITVRPQDLDEWQAVLTGAAAGATPSNVPIYGSFDLKVAIDANTELTLIANRVPFLTDWPDSDPGGGPAELELAFSVMRPLDASAAFTATVKNSTASY